MNKEQRQLMEERVALIASRTLGLTTLEARNRDALDRHTFAVWDIRAALEAAYSAGMVAGRRQG